MKKLNEKMLSLREDKSGLLVFSSYTGLIYAVPNPYKDAVKTWIKTENDSLVPPEIRNSLGVGWSIPLKKATFIRPHLLPTAEQWGTLPSPENPILINWFITGQCPLACAYCYAEDLMRNPSNEPGKKELVDSAQAILNLKPLVVVLTGGDPLFGGNFFGAASLLAGKVGLIVDTSGYTLNDRHIETIKEHGMAVRVSLDSENPRVHNLHRPIYSQYPDLEKKNGPSMQAALRAIERLLSENISVTVQTVATKKNANDLINMGEKLRRLGVTAWRILKVAPSEARLQNYKRLSGILHDDGRPAGERSAKGPYNHVFKELTKRYAKKGTSGFSLQIASNTIPNNVILVGPNGVFYTESNVNIKKVVIDDDRPRNPKLKSVHAKVDMDAHAKRYLNLTTEESYD